MLKRMMCGFTTGHQYVLTGSHLIEMGTNKAFYHQCKLCGKNKVTTL